MEYRLPDGTTGVYTPLESRLLTRALKRGTTGHGLDAQVRAVQRLKEIDIQAPVPLDAIIREMEHAAADELGTYLSSQVARRAEDLLSWLNGEGDVEEWESLTPDEPVIEGEYWPYRPGDPCFGDGFEVVLWVTHGGAARELEAVTHADRDDQRRRLEGDPPWVRGRVREGPEPDDVPPDDDDE